MRRRGSFAKNADTSFRASFSSSSHDHGGDEKYGGDDAVSVFHHLQEFHRVRRGMDDAWASVPNNEAVVAQIDACDHLKGPGGAYDAGCRQRMVDGSGAVASMDDLYTAAEAGLASFKPVEISAERHFFFGSNALHCTQLRPGSSFSRSALCGSLTGGYWSTGSRPSPCRWRR